MNIRDDFWSAPTRDEAIAEVEKADTEVIRTWVIRQTVSDIEDYGCDEAREALIRAYTGEDTVVPYNRMTREELVEEAIERLMDVEDEDWGEGQA